jgi:hypothetical protein
MLTSGPARPQSVKESALALFKEHLEAAALDWADNRAKSKKYAAIGEELAEFEDALKEGTVQLRRVSTKVFQVQCVTDCHHRCPPAGPRQKNFRNHPSHPTTCRHVGTKFGQISARSKMAIGKPLICIGFAAC